MAGRKVMKRLLIANRGEIAIRIARACRDHGLTSIAVYSDGDRDCAHVRSCDEAYALGGTTALESYLDGKKIVALALKVGADAIHPGYGFLSENADFASAVIDAGLIWIGPPPAAINALGDKVSARKIAAKVGAPLVAGTPDPVARAEDVVAFAKEYGLPVAIKAAFGGGGRGLKVARTLEEIPQLFESATREAIAGFGRGECFVERYLDKPRHVETQVLADSHGNVIVVSTRDCSLQRRHQKLVEEAPAPFLSKEQVATLYASSKALIKEAGYIGAGTCEFLVGIDGTISFLEVNTRLQVEHPVSEEVTGLDLVREQFRIAVGEEITGKDPEIRGHSIEFRINGEDPGRSFLPAPGVITEWNVPNGPGVRIDAGFGAGDEISGNFDSLLAKLIVTGATREEAISRARRALDEFNVGGMATAIPFHRAILEDENFTKEFKVYTSYIENEFKNEIKPFEGRESKRSESSISEQLVIEVDGKRFDVRVHQEPPRRARRREVSEASFAGAKGGAVHSPMQGTVVKIEVKEGDIVEAGALLFVLEAMKMEQPLTAHRAGKVTAISLSIGEMVTTGALLAIIDEL